MDSTESLTRADPSTTSAVDGGSHRVLSVRRGLLAALVPLFVLLLLWVWLFVQEGAFAKGPNGSTLAADTAMFVSAARVMQSGGNPYDPSVLYRIERSWLRTQHVRTLAKRGVIRVGNPPLMFWALRPLTNTPFDISAWIAVAFLELCSIGGLLLCLSYLGWTARLVPTLTFVMMPQVVLGSYYANVAPLVFLGLSAALYVSRRNPWLCGALLTFAWLKPPVALPVALLIALFLARDRFRAAAAFAITSLALLAVTLLAVEPGSVSEWIHGLTGYSNDIASSPSISSLSGLYVRWASAGLRTGLEVVFIVAALVLTAVAWKRYGTRHDLPVLAIGWLWLVWFLAAPYAHFYDEILLAVPVLALLGRNGSNLGRFVPTTSLYLLFLSLVLISAAPGGVQLLVVPLLLVTVLVMPRGNRLATEPA